MKLLIFCMMIVFISLGIVSSAYAGMDDKTDRLSNDQAGIFSPGYINAAKQKTDSIISQLSKMKNPVENEINAAKTELGNKVSEDAAERYAPELKKKSSAAGDTSKVAEKAAEKAVEAEPVPVEITAVSGSIAIGAGESKVFDASGRMLSEVIDGKTYVYAGFDNVGKSNIKEAISMAKAGDSIIVKSGTYSGPITMKSGVSLYGGYNENGLRDLINTPSTITSLVSTEDINMPTEFNGFTLKRTGVLRLMDISNGTGLTIANNIFDSPNVPYAVHVYRGASVTLINNRFNTRNGLLIEGMRVGMTQDGMAPSGPVCNVISINNDFNGTSYAMYGNGRSTITSTKDYFGGKDFYDSGESIAGVYYILNISVTDKALSANTAQSLTRASTTALIFSQSPAISTAYAIKDEYRSLLGVKPSQDQLNNSGLSSILAGLLNSKESLSGADGQINVKLVKEVVDEAMMMRSVLALPVDITGQEMNIALALAKILKNPTEDQKQILDAVASLLNDLKNTEDQSGSPELKKATDDLLQMVASILIAQAIPDLLKENDVANIKNIFAELNVAKGKIMIDYQEGTKPYYEEVKNMLSKNMAILQLDNIISNQMMEKELAKMEPKEIDKILEKIRKLEKKSFEEDYILQQEAKYRKTYIDPNKKMLEEKMKLMMKGFTQKISTVLEGASGAKK